MKILRVVLVIITVGVLLVSTDSGNRLNNLTVVQGIAVDSENGEYLITVQYLDLNRGSGKNEGLSSSLTSLAQGRGNTLKKACKNLVETLPDRLFFGQAKIIVFGKSLSEYDVETVEKEMFKNKNLRPDMLVAKSERAYSVLECGFRNERVPVDGVCKELKNENKLVFLNDLAENKTGLPEIIINGDCGYVKKRSRES